MYYVNGSEDIVNSLAGYAVTIRVRVMILSLHLMNINELANLTGPVVIVPFPVDKAPLPLRILRLVTSNFLPVENPTHPTAHAPERASVYILGQFRTSK